MIKFEIDSSGNSTLTAEGSGAEFSAGVAILIRRLYDEIYLNGTADEANEFVSSLILSLVDPESPLFEDTPFHEIQQEFEEETNEPQE